MIERQLATGLALAFLSMCLTPAAIADYRIATVIRAQTLEAARVAAPSDRVSDQAIRHVESAEGNLGIGVVHRPVIIPAGVAHGFSEITAPITYMVVRVDPEKLVELK